MYDWLDTALANDRALILTANRRLARELRQDYDQSQVANGRRAWRTPPIVAWRDWLATALTDAVDVAGLPVRISDSQARVLFEQCLRADLSHPFLRYARLARQCFDAWLRLHEWCVPMSEWQSSASGQDQRVFARAAGRYFERLSGRNWIDSALLPGLVIEEIGNSRLATPGNVFIAGFDRISPQLSNLLAAFEEAGGNWSQAPLEEPGAASLMRFEKPDAELRAAGRWARQLLEQDAGQRIAIVVGDLEQQAERTATLVREGFCPGWQAAGPSHAASVNLSYGKALSEYPAISIALLALRWLSASLRSRELSILLRSSFVAGSDSGTLSRFELWLRELPDRDWTISMVDGLLANPVLRERFNGIPEFTGRFQKAATETVATGGRATASVWASRFDAALEILGWPGEASLSSTDFQLINRWRNLLNEFARIELVLGETSGIDALGRLSGLAGDTVFQPEQKGGVISVIGPLEAAGLEFDRLWLTGATATTWPPSSRPLSLVSSDLQRRHGMPDSSPGDTARFARDVLSRLRRSCGELMVSYPAMIGDAEQLPSRLLDGIPEVPATPDPGWYADSLRGSVKIVATEDAAPPLVEGEAVRGGASTIERQRSDPFSAFAYGRLGIRWLAPFTTGIAANVRGNLVHAALQSLFRERTSSNAVRAWGEDEIERRIAKSLHVAFARLEAQADDVLEQLLAVERERTDRLLRKVIRYEREERTDFEIASVESRQVASFGRLNLDLRCDRVDQIPGNELVILDYKTGTKKTLVGRDGIRDLQLVVYACAVDRPTAGLGLYNVSSREVSISGAGPAFREEAGWSEQLDLWKAEVYRLAEQIVRGDARLNALQKTDEARPLSLLSRFPEVQREI